MQRARPDDDRLQPETCTRVVYPAAVVQLVFILVVWGRGGACWGEAFFVVVAEFSVAALQAAVASDQVFVEVLAEGLVGATVVFIHAALGVDFASFGVREQERAAPRHLVVLAGLHFFLRIALRKGFWSLTSFQVHSAQPARQAVN